MTEEQEHREKSIRESILNYFSDTDKEKIKTDSVSRSLFEMLVIREKLAESKYSCCCYGCREVGQLPPTKTKRPKFNIPEARE